MSDELKEIFSRILKVEFNDVENSSVQSLFHWDSLITMQLISETEDFFKIRFDIEDIVNLTSYSKFRDLVDFYLANED